MIDQVAWQASKEAPLQRGLDVRFHHTQEDGTVRTRLARSRCELRTDLVEAYLGTPDVVTNAHLTNCVLSSKAVTARSQVGGCPGGVGRVDREIPRRVDP